MGGLGLVAVSSVIGGFNVLASALVGKRFYSSKLHSSLIGQVIVVVSVLLAIVLPVLSAGFYMVLSDRNANSTFFDVSSGGDVLLYQHLFWIFGHPEVYVIILPAFGMVLYACTHDTSEIFNRLGVKYAIVSIALVGFFVWCHHMFVSGLDIDARTYFQAVTMLIALPTALKVFTWLASVIRSVFGRLVLYAILWFATVFILGGLTGLILAFSDVDVNLHDSYFVVGHFHYVLSLGAVLGLILVLQLAVQVALSSQAAEAPLRIFLGVLIVGSSTIFWPLHAAGILTLPRRVGDLSDLLIAYSSTAWVGLGLVCLAVVWYLTTRLEVVVVVYQVRGGGQVPYSLVPVKPPRPGVSLVPVATVQLAGSENIQPLGGQLLLPATSYTPQRVAAAGGTRPAGGSNSTRSGSQDTARTPAVEQTQQVVSLPGLGSTVVVVSLRSDRALRDYLHLHALVGALVSVSSGLA
jgi:heme/copper-type cytochrome/quinol oxidase subunit 1